MGEFENLVFWHWWVFALALMCIEIFIPIALFLSCGMAAVIVGFILLLIPSLSWQVQFLLFGIFCVVSVYLGRCWLRKKGAMKSDRPNLNRRGEQYVGRTFTLEEPIVNGTGRVRVDDSFWRISGDDMDAGLTIKVSGVVGSTFEVQQVEDK
jgi:membrane protein implicated in regulation of membrane protease activity